MAKSKAKQYIDSRQDAIAKKAGFVPESVGNGSFREMLSKAEGEGFAVAGHQLYRYAQTLGLQAKALELVDAGDSPSYLVPAWLVALHATFPSPDILGVMSPEFEAAARRVHRKPREQLLLIGECLLSKANLTEETRRSLSSAAKSYKNA